MSKEKYNSGRSVDDAARKKEKHSKLFHDKRVRSILRCPLCGDPMTAAEAKRNRGVCDFCAANVVFEVEV